MSDSVPAGPDAWIAVLQAQPLGNYNLERCIGKGNFGLVFEATNALTDARFAVKVLVPGANAENSVDFENEGLLLRQLNRCDGVINYVDGGTEHIEMQAGPGISVSLAIQYHVLTIAAGSVDELILDPGARERLGWVEKLRIWRDVVKAVRQMHSSGVAHRDLKCSNCLLLVRGNQSVVRLADLGRAKDLNNGPTRSLEHYLHGRGDLRFAPPEFLYLQGGAASQDFIAADYYGVGSLLVELASGQPISTLALGDFSEVLDQAKRDLIAGQRREIGVLSMRYRQVVADIVTEMPRSIQLDAQTLLAHLCHPVPSERLARAPYSRDRLSGTGLAWVLRRADIMIRRLEIEAREERRMLERVRMSA